MEHLKILEKLESGANSYRKRNAFCSDRIKPLVCKYDECKFIREILHVVDRLDVKFLEIYEIFTISAHSAHCNIVWTSSKFGIMWKLKQK